MAELPLIFGVGGIMGYLLAHTDKIDNKTNEPQYQLTEIRNPDSLSSETRSIIDLITLQENINPVGSQKYKIHKYPSDIDIFETYRSCCDVYTATIDIAERLRKMGTEIKKNNKVYFGDFKAGLDDRYDIDIGEINYLDHTVKNYNKKQVIKNLIGLYNKKLLTDVEYSEIITLINLPFSFDNYEKIKNIIKNKKTVRWTLDELIIGSKKLTGNVDLSLEEALTQKSIVKIDVWAMVQGNRYTEITSFFLFIYADKNGQEHILNMELGDVIDSLLQDVVYYSSDEHKKSMKLAKRMWQLAMYLHYDELLQKLTPLFQSDIGILNQIAGDIEVLMLMLNKLPNPPMDSIIKEIDEFKGRLGSYQLTKLDDKLIFMLIDDIVGMYRSYKSKIDKSLVIKNLTYIQNYLLAIVEAYASSYLINNDISVDALVKHIKG